MERIMATLTDEQQPLVGPVLFPSVSTHGACLGSVVGIHFDRHALILKGFVGDHAVQFSKRPFGESSIGFPLLLARLFTLASWGSFSDVCQVLQSDQAVWVLGHDVLGNDMIGVLLQPSLSSRD